MLGPKFPGRLLNQQDLAIDGVVHGFPPLGVSMQFAPFEALNCPAALLTTLVGGRSFHNGNIVAKALTV
jgi:hypothetical protein